MPQWRNDYQKQGMATIDTVVIQANDFIRKQDIYDLNIRHVIGFHGKGFMAAVYCGGSGGKSDVFYGTKTDAYLLCLNEGRLMLKEMIEALEKDMEKYSEN